MNALQELFKVVKTRKESPMEGSYTNYLFDQGLDKILKKCGEECAETIIAAKNQNPKEIASEICDLLYHLTVLSVASGVELSKIETILQERSAKIGNLKQMKVTDKNT